MRYAVELQGVKLHKIAIKQAEELCNHPKLSEK